ncbi:sugar phosphate isomerase/epimerase [Rhodopirellula sp. JC737]|nr:sugar phosphate isomerase/epimerase [Rhodopirellula sp. JC737]
MPNFMQRRRAFLATAATAAAVPAAWPNSVSANQSSPASLSEISTPPLAMNTSTLRGHQLTVPEQIDVVAKAGFDGIEPWIRDLRAYVESGGKVSDLKKQLDDSGLKVVGAIGFARWIVDDAAARQAGLDEAKRDMELVAEIGGNQMAAPPIGAHRNEELDDGGAPSLETIGERYRAILELGETMGVTPLLELWGFSPVLHRLAELAYVSTAAAHPAAAVLPDFYHIYKGGNDMASLGMIEASRMPLFHINDYPAEPAIDAIADKDRVYPGDGVCDLVGTISMLLQHGFVGTFSLELFNPEYWKQPADKVATEGHDKSRAVIDKAVAAAKQAVSGQV